MMSEQSNFFLFWQAIHATFHELSDNGTTPQVNQREPVDSGVTYVYF